MKGVVFTELISMAEQDFGADTVDHILSRCELPSGGAYTTVGTYDHSELLKIVAEMSRYYGLPLRSMVSRYGYYLFSRFSTLMPQFFVEPRSAFDFLETVEDKIHIEVKKLYPEAQLPSFQTERIDQNEMRMTYQSRCPFADLAEGLIRGCIDHYGGGINLTAADDSSQYARQFILTREGMAHAG